MQKIAIHTRLKPGKENDYDTTHRTIPKELHILLKKYGIQDWRIYRNGRDLFHFVECDDYAKFLASIANEPVNVAWQAKMAEFLEVIHDYTNADKNTLPLVWELS